MKIYLKENVYDAAQKRIRWLFSEFPNIVVGVSGGKDSTVVFEMTLAIARELKRLPLKVFFLDQEAEWQATIDQVQRIMEHPDVEPLWCQFEFRLFNATSATEHWLTCWDKTKEHLWMRPKWPGSIQENRYKETRFAKMFEAVLKTDFPNTKTCYIAGVRCEESPSRYIAMLGHTYKGACWGRMLNGKRQHFTFYPIYDWQTSDVWKAIHSHGWDYNNLYNDQFRYGTPLQEMRVSNVHHETAVRSLFSLQEIEPKTYERLCARISGIDMAAHMGDDDYFVKELPYMFKDWREYRDYLLEKLISNPDWRANFEKCFKRMDGLYLDVFGDKMLRTQIQSILTNDWELVKLINYERSPDVALVRQQKQREQKAHDLKTGN